MTDIEDRTIRRDARRNRQRLIDAALHAFTSGRDPVTLEAIARDAGVGIGTLYRHFPTRESLVEAAYRSELGRLRASAEDLLAELRPDAALRAWMDQFAEYVTAKRGMVETLRAIAAAGAITPSQTREQVIDTITMLLAAGVAAGTVRADVRADDLFASLTGIFLAAGAVEQRDQAGRILDLFMAGLRTATARP